jgi:hypothetical protein
MNLAKVHSRYVTKIANPFIANQSRIVLTVDVEFFSTRTAGIEPSRKKKPK